MYDMSALMSTVFYACFGIVLMIAASRIIDFFIPGDFEVEIKRGNRAVAWLCAGSFIGVGEILRAVILSPYGEAADVGFLTGVTSSLLYAALGIFFFIFGFFVVNLWCRQYSLPEEIRKGNTAAGIMVFGIFVGLSLVISGAVVLGMHLLGGDSANGPTAPSNSWAKGSHKAWDMNIGERSMLIGNKDQLVVVDMDSDYNIDTVTAYDVSGDKPKKQWSADPRTDSFYLSYWGDYLIAGDTLIKADTGKTTDAPWHNNPIIVGAYAFSCSRKDQCTGWSASNPDQKLWETSVSGSSDFQGTPSASRSIYQGDGKLIVQASESTWINVITGDVYDFDTTSSDFVFALTDGWCKYDYKKGRFTILSPTGEERESFDGEYPEDVSTASTLDHPLMSAAEFKSFIQDEDVSWAKIKITRAKNSSSSCSTKLTIGESTFKPANESGECYEPDGTVLYALSSDESVLMRASTDPTSTSTGMWLSGAWTVKDGETIDFPGNDFDSGTVFYLVNPELIVARDTSGELTAYRPGKK